MEAVCDPENLVRAWKRVRQNKSSPGVDRMTIGNARDYLREHWPSIRSQLLEGTYRPKSSSSFGSRPNGGAEFSAKLECGVDRYAARSPL
jgi:RNA-directed DNA polymerase